MEVARSVMRVVTAAETSTTSAVPGERARSTVRRLPTSRWMSLWRPERVALMR